MNRLVNAISGRLSLRPPQRQSLEILARVTEIVPPRKGADLGAVLETIRSEFPSVTDFEREFPSMCFALATGVGKTRLMGAFITYLHLEHGIENFFVLAPNLTIYNKLIADFTPNTPKYVFKGIAEFATSPPKVITGETYDQVAVDLFDQLINCRVNIFNISKINSEVRGGKAPRIKRLSEYLGHSYFDFLAGLDDLCLLMDESHRYRASAGVRAINELNPVLGLELTATPFIESNKGPLPFKNVIFDYPLGRAMADGFVKEPAVVTRKDFDATKMSPAEVERLKLEDGIRLHEQTKVKLETYARETEKEIVKPFLLVIARDTTHAASLLELIESESFFGGTYKGRAIQVDSSQSGAKEEEMIERLLKVEHADEPTEVVIHVNMLKEGWDVTNLYTIVPLRAANARILIEQSIGRGLRLPYGRRTGEPAVDRLTIVAHDKFQEIIDEANREDSPVRLKALVLTDEELKDKPVSVIAQPNIAARLGLQPSGGSTSSAAGVPSAVAPLFGTPAEQAVAQAAYAVIQKASRDTKRAPTSASLLSEENQAWLVQEIESTYLTARQLELEGVHPEVDLKKTVARTTESLVKETMDIPRIVLVPKGEVRCGFTPFQLDCRNLRPQPPEEEMWLQYLRTHVTETIELGPAVASEKRPEDHLVFALIDFDDVSYDDHAELLYDLASQAVAHLRSYLDEEKVERVLRFHRREIARLIHAQMQEHYWEEADSHEVQISQGWMPMKEPSYTTSHGQEALDFRHSPPDKTKWGRYLFGGFERSLYQVTKFHSEAERVMAVILDRDSSKWFRPAKGQFPIYYREGVNQPAYDPDFAAEAASTNYLIESKARNEMDDPIVQAKKSAAEEWCRHASDHSAANGGKRWRYLLIPHDAIKENRTLEGLAREFGQR